MSRTCPLCLLSVQFMTRHFLLQMSETTLPPATRTRRPKRSLTKTSDDNVLGISWKEERELRKAMYVSLRPQQRSTGYRLRLASNSSFRVRHPVKLPPVENSHQIGVIEANAYPLRWRHHRTAATTDWTADSRLRKAKLRATARLSADAMSARKLMVAAASPSIKPSNPKLKKTLRVRKVTYFNFNFVLFVFFHTDRAYTHNGLVQ
ncbi:hypothetical protein AHF37_09023 [Paragonimus kellicotti]|nr:hypothetical protein AHF37_09023 [Paragonimus kellicotti]